MSDPTAADSAMRLVELARSGDRAAFTQLVRMHQSAVRVYVAFYVHREDVVDDLLQEIFLTAFRCLANYRGESTLGRWLIGIARTRTLDFVRSEARRRARVDRSFETLLAEWRAWLLDREDPPVAARERELGALRQCLEKLPSDSVGLVRRHYFQQERLVDIAGQLRRSESAVRMALLRTRQALRDCIRRSAAEAPT